MFDLINDRTTIVATSTENLRSFKNFFSSTKLSIAEKDKSAQYPIEIILSFKLVK